VDEPDLWRAAVAYEVYVGRWSRLVARRFVVRLGVPTGSRWLDVGCGTGALTEEVLRLCSPALVLGLDPSVPFVGRAAAHVPDPCAAFCQGSAQGLPVADAAVDAVVSGLVLNFVPDRPAALAEMRRATRPGGTVAAYVWDYADGMQLIRHFWDAAVECDPAARPLDEGVRFPDCRPGSLAELFTGADLHDVAVEEVVVPTRFVDFDDYWAPFLGGAGPAPAYVASLDEDPRAALREALRARVPVADDGSVHLTARAWAVRGRRP
jgi:SAM-dependent methyltransferase